MSICKEIKILPWYFQLLISNKIQLIHSYIYIYITFHIPVHICQSPHLPAKVNLRLFSAEERKLS